MKLKTFVEEIEINEYNAAVKLFLNSLIESVNTDNKILLEDITSSCLYKKREDGTQQQGLTNKISDDDLIKKLQDIKAGDSSGFKNGVADKAGCLKAIVTQLTGVDVGGCPEAEPCDITTDNPQVKKVVTDKIQKMWMAIQSAGAQKSSVGFKAAFGAMKDMFASQYKTIIAAPATTTA
jgi:hypothetical protein